MAHFPGFVFYIPCSHCRVRSNCPSSAKLCRRPLANLPPVSTLYLPHRSLYHMMPKLFTYLFPGSKPEAESYLSCFPSVWKSTSSQQTHWKVDGWMNWSWAARWIGQARELPLVFSLSPGRYPSKYLCKRVEILPAIEWPQASNATVHVYHHLKGTWGSKPVHQRPVEPSKLANPQGKEISFLKTLLNRGTFSASS